MNSWHYNMARFRVHELYDTLAEVCFHHFYPIALEIRIQFTFLCEHRLALHHFAHTMAFDNVKHYAVELFSILGPVNDSAVAFGIGGKQVEIMVEMGDGMLFYVAGHLSQLFPFVEMHGYIIPFPSYRPESGVVPFGFF